MPDELSSASRTVKGTPSTYVLPEASARSACIYVLPEASMHDIAHTYELPEASVESICVYVLSEASTHVIGQRDCNTYAE